MKRLIILSVSLLWSCFALAGTDTAFIDEVVMEDSSGWKAHFTLKTCFDNGCSSEYTACVASDNGINFTATDDISYATILTAKTTSRVITVAFDDVSCDLDKITFE